MKRGYSKARGNGKGLSRFIDDKESTKSFVGMCDLDDDAVSVDYLPGAPAAIDDFVRCEGALVVIKGGKAVALFRQWAIRNGLLTPGKPLSSNEPPMRSNMTPFPWK